MDPEDLLQKPEKVQWRPVRSFFPTAKESSNNPPQGFFKHVFLKGNTGLFGIFFGIIFWENFAFFKQVFLLVSGEHEVI